MKAKDIRMPFDTESRRISPLAKMEGNFFEWNLPAKAFATLTTLHRVTPYRLDELFLAWIQGVQAQHRMTLGWIKTIEIGPQPHIHAALIAAAPLDCDDAALRWRAMVAPRFTKAAQVEPYVNNLCGLPYIVKRLGSSSEEPQLSDNILAFARGNGKSLFRTNSAQRRQVSRIKAAMQQAAMQDDASFRAD
jgi:hypothetical protein